MLKNMKLSKLLSLNQLIVIFLSVVIMAAGLTGLNSTKKEYENVLDGNVEVDLHLNSAYAAVNVISSSLRDMVIAGESVDADATERINAHIETLNTDIEAIRKIIPQDEDMVKLQEFIDAFVKDTNETVGLFQKGEREQAQMLIVETEKTSLSQIAQYSLELIDKSGQMQEQAIDEIRQNVARIMVFLVAAMVVMIIASVLMSAKVVVTISKPVGEVQNALNQFAQGKFETEIEFEGRNELGEMCDALRVTEKTLKDVIEDVYYVLNEMAGGNLAVKSRNREMYIGSLKPVIEAMRGIGDKLSVTIEQIKQSADQVSQGSEQVSNGAQMLAQGATEQASAIEGLQNHIGVIAENSKKNAENSRMAIEHSEEAGNQVGESAQYMEELVKAMDNISKTSEEIGKIVATIDNIAFQTNILALNAAVEAARAGSAGKGFAVVADEVRTLASNSGEAAQSITGLIEQSIQAVKTGNDIVQNISGSMDKTVQVTAKTVEDIKLISDAALKESQLIEEVITSINQISAVVQTNSATSEESAAASQELSSQAMTMNRLMDQFSIRS